MIKRIIPDSGRTGRFNSHVDDDCNGWRQPLQFAWSTRDSVGGAKNNTAMDDRTIRAFTCRMFYKDLQRITTVCFIHLPVWTNFPNSNEEGTHWHEQAVERRPDMRALCRTNGAHMLVRQQSGNQHIVNILFAAFASCHIL
jgi:hypothetical protein